MTSAGVFLQAAIARNDRAWAWGVGPSMAPPVAKRLTVVHHDRVTAATSVLLAHPNTTVIYAPPEPASLEPGADSDDDLTTYRRYVEAYTGGGIDVVLFFGRARTACAHQVAQLARVGPNPAMRFFLLDPDQHERIWKDDEASGWQAWFEPEERVGNILRMRARI